MEPIEGRERWVKMCPDICLSWAHRSAAELPTPKFTQDMRADFTHVQARQGWSLGLCAGNSGHCQTWYCFSEISFHPPPQFRMQLWTLVWVGGHEIKGTAQLERALLHRGNISPKISQSTNWPDLKFVVFLIFAPNPLAKPDRNLQVRCCCPGPHCPSPLWVASKCVGAHRVLFCTMLSCFHATVWAAGFRLRALVNSCWCTHGALWMARLPPRMAGNYFY